MGKRGFYGVEQIEGGELVVGSATGPVGFQAEVLLVLKPVGNLLDSGLLQVGREWGLAGGGVGARQDIPTSVRDPGEGWSRRREKGEGRIQ